MQHTSVKPLGDRVLVKIKDVEEKTEGGILLPATAQSKPQGGEVVAVGEGKDKVGISVKVMCYFVRISLTVQAILNFFCFCIWGLEIGEGGIFMLILTLCDAFVCADRCTSCVFKVCRD